MTAQENPNVEPEKAQPTSLKKPCSEIREIFSMRKRMKAGPEVAPNPLEKVCSLKLKDMKKEKRKKVRNEESGFAESPQPRKKTRDGISVYTEEELSIGRVGAGDTPLCPFDCSCCF